MATASIGRLIVIAPGQLCTSDIHRHRAESSKSRMPAAVHGLNFTVRENEVETTGAEVREQRAIHDELVDIKIEVDLLDD